MACVYRCDPSYASRRRLVPLIVAATVIKGRRSTNPFSRTYRMRVSVFGLGYVGCVSAACFAREGFHVVGVDVNQAKVADIAEGQSTIVEDGIAELVKEVVNSGRLTATSDTVRAVLDTDISLICVGTPSRPNGDIDLQYIERVCEEIGAALADKPENHIVVIRSTVLPGTIEDLVIPTIERSSGKLVDQGFTVCSNPEFLREGSSIRDFHDPPFTLIGSSSAGAGEQVAQLYAAIEAKVFLTDIRVAEAVKYVCNCFHGMKIGFANEIGNACKAMGIDSHEVMSIVCEDTKLNISPAYLKPGFAFGGSCLPKDLRALAYRARQLDVPTPILSSILEANRQQVERGISMVLATGVRRVGVLGMAFKAGTDDVRESPIVSLIESLLGKGLDLAIYDRFVSEAGLIGANRTFIENEIPHIWSLMSDSIEEVIEHSEVLVIGNGSPEFGAALGQVQGGPIIVDLARALGNRQSEGSYHGIAW